MDVFILKTNLTKPDGRTPEIIGVYDSYSAALKGKDDLVEEFKEIMGGSETVSEKSSEDSSITFIYPKSLNGPVYWYSIAKKTLNTEPETWIVTSDNSKTIGIFSSKEQALNAVKEYCRRVYDYEVSDEALLSSYIFIHIKDRGFDSNRTLHVDTFKIKQLKLNQLHADWFI